jgi:hypothetical protein
MVTPAAKPSYAAALEAAFGPSSQAAFGSAVFYEQGSLSGGLEKAAQAYYRYFVGDLWERYGEAAWLGNWQQVYTRAPGAGRAIAEELRSIEDHDAAMAAALLLDETQDAQNAQVALAEAFDDPAVTELAVYKIGDGAALAGILVAARRAADGQTILLAFLLD